MIILKDNINQNSKSTITIMHYYGTSLSIFQFPTEENPGIAVKFGDQKTHPTKHLRKSMHFHFLTYALKTSLLHFKHLRCLLDCLLHHFEPPQTVIIEMKYQKR